MSKKDNTSLWVIIITLVLTVLMVIGLSYAGKSQQNENSNMETSQLQALESSYDFGTISMAKGKVTKNFIIKNNTAKTIVAKKLYTSCMCTKASLLKDGNVIGPFGMPAHGSIPSINQDIEPGKEVQIEAVFDPAAHGPAGVGPIEREVTLETSDGKLTFKFKAQVTP